MAVVHPRTRLGAGLLLGWGPLRWIGERSYGIYLWHWPIFAITRPGLDVPLDGLPLLALRLAATILLAHLSYRYVEEPIRRGALGRAWKALRRARGRRRQHLRRRWAGAVVSGLAFCAVLGVAVARAEPPDQPSYLSSMKAVHTAEAVPRTSTAEVDSPPTDESPHPQGLQKDQPTQSGSDKDPQNPKAETGDRARAAGPRADKNPSNTKPGTESTARGATSTEAAREFTGSVSAIGDSVMLGAVGRLQKDIGGLSVVDAEVGMQVYTAVDILHARAASDQVGEVVVVHLGNNGTFTAEEFDEIMKTLSGVEKVVFVNVKVPRAWEQPNNEVIAAGVQKYPNAVLVDWYSASVNRPELFYRDGFHLRPGGQKVYADLISSYLNAP
jgi:hypothetical protein